MMKLQFIKAAEKCCNPDERAKEQSHSHQELTENDHSGEPTVRLNVDKILEKLRYQS
jgi:hypothetical protein